MFRVVISSIGVSIGDYFLIENEKTGEASKSVIKRRKGEKQLRRKGKTSENNRAKK